MLVDDDDAFRALLRTTFEAVDVEVDEAANAIAAQERIAAARPDAIVMDVAMPGLDGVALCSLLKTTPATRSIPIVLLTGSGVTDEATAQEVGADALLLKPFSPLELLAVVERVAAGLHATPASICSPSSVCVRISSNSSSLSGPGFWRIRSGIPILPTSWSMKP